MSGGGKAMREAKSDPSASPSAPGAGTGAKPRRTSTERRQASDERQRAEGRVRVAGWVSAEGLALLDRLVAALGSRDVALDTVLHHVDLEIRNGMRAIGRPVWQDGVPVRSGERETISANVPVAAMAILERAGADAGYRTRTEAVLAVGARPRCPPARSWAPVAAGMAVGLEDTRRIAEGTLLNKSVVPREFGQPNFA